MAILDDQIAKARNKLAALEAKDKARTQRLKASERKALERDRTRSAIIVGSLIGSAKDKDPALARAVAVVLASVTRPQDIAVLQRTGWLEPAPAPEPVPMPAPEPVWSPFEDGRRQGMVMALRRGDNDTAAHALKTLMVRTNRARAELVMQSAISEAGPDVSQDSLDLLMKAFDELSSLR